jgi:hypothetical protein
MKNTIFNGVKTTLLFVFLTIISLAVVYGINFVEPSMPYSMTYMGNASNNYPVGTMQNLTRGYIHTINIYEKQPTFKWIGVVGNITGKFALQDVDGFALYDWSISTVTGEVYATRHAEIPAWESIGCANIANITNEESWLNHTIAYSARADEDSLTRTFTSSGANFNPFYVGQDVQIVDEASCYGVNLNRNDTHASIGMNWTEVMLTDGTLYDTSRGGSQRYITKMTYASLIQNRTLGYRNDSSYDFQMLLPQSGLEGQGIGNIAYYFYVELI